MPLSLVNRVSLYFAAALALVLAVYSATLYVVLSRQLHLQFDSRLEATLRTLVAAIEVEDDDVKWEPTDHTIGVGRGDEGIRWIVVDERGFIVDRSRNLLAPKPLDARLLEDFARADDESHPPRHGRTEADDTVMLYARLAASHPKPAEERDQRERESLRIFVFQSTAELAASLRMLAATVIVLPLAIGALASVIVRWLCRRALEPVREMASEARAMARADADRRLPVAPTRDELADLGEAFNSVLDRLFETSARQRRFAGDAAHQLRTPLTAVIGQLDVALRRPRSPEEYRETLAVVREQADELHRLVESMLFLARAESDAALPDAETFDAAAWLRAYSAAWSTHARAADLRFDFGPADGLASASIRASRVLLKQLLDNLVSNALKYGDVGTPVTVAARSVVAGGGREWELSVADEGIGIAAEDLAAVFTPFFRSAEARRSGTAGTGLGLAVASRIASALGGKLTCTSELGRGSRFTLTLPTVS